MFITMVTTECAPVAKVGGLGNVVQGLSKEISIRGNAVEIILPKYDCLRYDRIYGLWKRGAQEVAVVQEAEKQLEAARAALEANRARVETKRAQVKQATEQFESQVNAIVQSVGSTTSLSAAATQLQAAVKQLGSSYSQTLAKIDCS